MRILLFVDPTFRGDWAVSLAQDLAAGLGGPLTLLTTEQNLEADPRLLERSAEKFAGLPGLAIEKKSRPGPARDAIIAETMESRPAITIVPPAGRGKLSRMLKGSRVKAVVHNAPATVMVARKPVSEHIRRLLVAVGGGPMSEPTVVSALEIAKALHASVTLLHVTSSVSIPFGEGTTVKPGASVDLTPVVEILRREGIETQVKLREGFVVREILAECHEGNCDLVVLGQHLVRREFGGPLSENLAEDIVMECPLPVLVVRPRRLAAGTAAES